MSHDARHTTSDVVTVFARQAVPLATIARAMAIPVERVQGMCQRARENGELQMIPPTTPDDVRHNMLVEVTNLRAQLDDAQAEIRELQTANEEAFSTFRGIAKLTNSESTVLAAIVQYGRASKPAIYHAMYGAADVEREPKIVDVMVCKIRRKLKPHGIEIDTVWGFGYNITTENVAKLTALRDAAHLATVPARRFVDSPAMVPA